MKDVELRGARTEDEGEISALLARCELPNEDIAEHLADFVVAVAENEIVGTVGLEVIGRSGLLRSLAVAPSMRGFGLAKGLWRRLKKRAELNGVGELYLLTTTAEGFFSRLGFETVERDAVPEGVQGTKEYSSLCPTSAVCMRRRIGPPGGG